MNANIAPPSTAPAWFKLVGVKLGNETEAYPAGDTVQTVEPWTPAPLFDGLSEPDLNKVLGKLAAALPNQFRDGLRAARCVPAPSLSPASESSALISALSPI